MSSRGIIALAALVAAIAYIQWMIVPAPTGGRAIPPADDRWEIASAQPPAAAQAVEMLNKSSLWGKAAEAPPVAVADSNWRFLGAMARGRERYVIVQVGNQPERRLAPGDKLPDGTPIVDIGHDRICVLVNNKKRSLAIYPQGPLSGKMTSLPE